MRIISGDLKGRVIEGVVVKTTRPTMDRVKESVFAILNPYLETKVFLDLFSGTGSIGLEAISNGAKEVIFNDLNKICIKNINYNIIKNNLQEKTKIYNLDYLDLLKKLTKENKKIDIIYVDPPYNSEIIKIIDDINNSNILANNGLIVVETSQRLELANLVKYKKYGNKYVYILANMD